MGLSLLTYNLWIISHIPNRYLPKYSHFYYLFKAFLLIGLAVAFLILLFATKFATQLDIALGFDLNGLIYALLGISSFMLFGHFLISGKKIKNQRSYYQLSQLLEQHFLTQPTYLNPDLTLSELAAQLQVSKSDCKAAIATLGYRNIYHYLAKWRVDYAQNLIKADTSRKLKIEYFARASGFKSKASFNRHFREITGYTPSLYRQMAHNANRHEVVI